jgi:PAS domain S-box-containing protein
MEAMQAGATLYVTKTEATPLLLERSIRYAIERKRIEEELDRRLRERSDILESIQDGFFSIDRNWVITYINQRAARNGGFEPEELTGRSIWEAFPRLLGTSFEQNYRLVMDQRTPVQFEVQGVYKGTWYNISVYPFAEGISVFWQDISERKRMEAELHSVALFPEENPNPVMRLSAEGALIYANPTSKTLLLNWGCEDQPSLPEKLLNAAADALNTGAERQLDLDCGDRTFLFVITPITGQGYVNLYGVDITERKRMEVTLRENEERSRSKE